jgi:hypothetical protein
MYVDKEKHSHKYTAATAPYGNYEEAPQNG